MRWPEVEAAARATGSNPESIQRVLDVIFEKGRLYAEECMQLASLGLPVYQILADAHRTTPVEIKRAVEEGEQHWLNADSVVNAILRDWSQRYKAA